MVSTRQSSNSSTNVEASLLELGKNYDAGPSGTSRRSQQQQQHPQQPANGVFSTTGVLVPEEESSCNNSSNNYIVNLLDLPVEIIQKILSYMGYNTIAHLRLICHQMDKICGSILNSTFQRLQTQMLTRFQTIKGQMPRRESARRNHPLACESDIIETLHMRLTLLQMSFGKHIERKHCCFFPGEILDEVYRILHYIKVTPKLARPYKVTDELFDLSTMAMEYFKDCIEPRLPEIPYFGAEFLDLAGTFSSPLSVTDGKARCSGSGGESSPSRSGNDEPGSCSSGLEVTHSAPAVVPPQSNMVLRKRIRKIKQGMKRYNSQLSLMRRDLRNCKVKIADQQKQIVEYATRLDDNDKKSEETSRKFSTLLQELNKCKTELQYWRSKSPAIPVCFGCGQSIPLPTEDLQALANQGVLSNVEASAGGDLDFIPIADMAVRSPTEQEVSLGIHATPAQQLLQPQLQQPVQLLQSCSGISSNSSGGSGSSASSTAMPVLEPMAPPKAPSPLSAAPSISSSSSSNSLSLTSSKRKSSLITGSLDEDAARKPRRALKARQAKRSKMI
ncbi:F-box only protein 28 isoform X2 [Copidosoma floridanum]|uniref:F-box only protein 28 isoform X2 n=1 Tax=Copidosoma floridanum TaxID=29053 RepID=UPI0006C9450A|nr:F-box only protein 28 isoform X2 [Copidosoma floridanum]